MQDQALALMPYEVGHMAQKFFRMSADIAELPDMHQAGFLADLVGAGLHQDYGGGFLNIHREVRDEAAASPEPEGPMLAAALDTALAMTEVASSQLRGVAESIMNVVKNVTSADEIGALNMAAA